MKFAIGFLVLALCAFQLISAWPARNTGGMVFYQPDYYRHRAFVMQYASQPVARAYRRQGQAAGVSAYASGKKITTGTYLKQTDDEDDEQQSSEDQPQRGGPAQSTSIAVASPDGPVLEQEQDSRESFTPQENNSVPARDEEQEIEDEEEIAPTKKRVSKGKEGGGVTYFPINFGGNPGVVAIANSYSTGKGGSASSRATAYGSSKSKTAKRTH